MREGTGRGWKGKGRKEERKGEEPALRNILA